MSYTFCPCCKQKFKLSKGIQMHWSHNERCRSFMFSETSLVTMPYETMVEGKKASSYNEIDDENNFMILSDDRNDSCMETDLGKASSEQYLELLQQQSLLRSKRLDIAAIPLPAYKAATDLLQLLKTCNAPLYMFDQIMAWAVKATNVHNFNFVSTQIPTREGFVSTLKN